MNRYTIDRFEGELAILLKKGNESIQKEVPMKCFPEEITEGDIVEEYPKDGAQHYRILVDETEKARSKAEELLKKLRNK
ncbi:DUF3006 domain-containing protein [Pseudalkalibacillus salsuginis]|uniref:DUF3006 domain-containing protein n=1 Tax=Pseudalkalibacillus salsuginis TaxID=2910972 RepID=UPI001F33584A|nr:DUF3006 domain-containing protein [Pseudalkalibacillus salsuginis]MCF6410100.1 DUF3006 domain-containing protein [Pseudalkalibacillus salsuginis]